MNIFIIVLLIIIAALSALSVFLIIKNSRNDVSSYEESIKKIIEAQNSSLRSEINSANNQNLRSILDVVSRNQTDISDAQSRQLAAIDKNLNDRQTASSELISKMSSQLEQRFQSFALESEQRLDNIRRSVESSMGKLQEDNNLRLDKIQGVVDLKLQKTLDDRMTQAFSLVNQRLEQVYKGLGEMQSLASGVGDLKKVLTNVKSRGILGEVQLGAILQDILSPSQYEVNAKIKSGFVEFAVKIPTENGDTVLLPIDSKFPGDAYANFRDAYESGVAADIDTARKTLMNTLKSEANDICSKYINPPDTTDFAIMFIPFEGLYAEAVNFGMIELLQRTYRVNIAGPSTMAALLNSLQMSFRSMAIRKSSDNVWRVLGEVRTEFDKFTDALEKTQQRIETANDELNKLVGVRTRQMQKQLRKVAEYDFDSVENNDN